MFRFNTEEMKKIMEVADLFKEMIQDDSLEKLTEENDEFDSFLNVAVDEAIPKLRQVMEFYDDYLRDEFNKLYVDGYIDTYGFNRED